MSMPPLAVSVQPDAKRPTRRVHTRHLVHMPHPLECRPRAPDAGPGRIVHAAFSVPTRLPSQPASVPIQQMSTDRRTHEECQEAQGQHSKTQKKPFVGEKIDTSVHLLITEKDQTNQVNGTPRVTPRVTVF